MTRQSNSGATTAKSYKISRLKRLYDRAMDWDGARYDELTTRILHQRSKRKLISLTPDQMSRWPLLVAHVAVHDGWLPSITRDYTARHRHLDALYDAYGSLVLLRHDLNELNELPLRGTDLAPAARPLILETAAHLLLPGTRYTVNVQRGAWGGTHWHAVAPLKSLRPEHAELVNAAKHGSGGGCGLLDGGAFGVVLLDNPEARKKVARYVMRHPDGRFDQPGTEGYLDALEAELEKHDAPRMPAPRLSWEVGVRSLLRTY